MVGWHHWLNGHGFEQALGIDDGHGSLACYGPWCCEESNTTEWLSLSHSFKIDRFDLLAVQGTLKSLLQHHSSNASILRCSAYFRVQLSHPYMTTGKTIALTRWTFVGKVMSLIFNMLPRLVTAFLPRSKCLLIPWLQSPSTVNLEPPKINLSLFPLFPHVFALKWWDQMPWS